MRILKRLWRDDAGFVASTDLLLIAVIVGLGTVVGLVALRDQVVQELTDVAQAIGHLNQSYRFEGDNDSEPDGAPDDSGKGFVAGSAYADKTDAGQGPDTAGSEPFGIDLVLPIGDLDEETPLP